MRDGYVRAYIGAYLGGERDDRWILRLCLVSGCIFRPLRMVHRSIVQAFATWIEELDTQCRIEAEAEAIALMRDRPPWYA